MIETGKVLQQRYRIQKQIGQGGMGAVYVATDERFGSTVAIKETLFMDDNYRKAIEREARLLNSLKHAALPRVSDHFLEDNRQFLVMEYISGEDLGFVIEDTNRPFPVQQVLTWADQLLDALDFLHTQVNPVVHRDIKPQNLKVTPKGQIVLLDFGLAKGNPTDAGHQTAAKSIFGYSRNYASLEQIQGTGTDPRSDLYSLAATLYHLLTNSPPEDALTRAMAMVSHQPDPLVPANEIVSEIPPGVAGVLHKALALNAAQRPASASEMREMLRDHEQYSDLAPAVTARAVIPAELHSQRTKIMPGSTIHDGGRQTDVKTEVMPGPLSQLTALKPAVNDTAQGPKRRRFGLAAAGLAVVLAGTALGGAYLYDPAFFFNEETEPSPAAFVAPVEEAKPVETDSNTATAESEAPAAIEPEQNTNTGAIASAGPATRSSETAKPSRGQTAANRNTDDDDDPGDDILFDKDAIYVGNTRIERNRIETPDRDGFTTQHPVPPNPNFRPVIPPIDMRNMTPRQRRRLQEILRKNGVTMRPSPTPQN